MIFINKCLKLQDASLNDLQKVVPQYPTTTIDITGLRLI